MRSESKLGLLVLLAMSACTAFSASGDGTPNGDASTGSIDAGDESRLGQQPSDAGGGDVEVVEDANEPTCVDESLVLGSADTVVDALGVPEQVTVGYGFGAAVSVVAPVVVRCVHVFLSAGAPPPELLVGVYQSALNQPTVLVANATATVPSLKSGWNKLPLNKGVLVTAQTVLYIAAHPNGGQVFLQINANCNNTPLGEHLNNVKGDVLPSPFGTTSTSLSRCQAALYLTR